MNVFNAFLNFTATFVFDQCPSRGAASRSARRKWDKEFDSVSENEPHDICDRASSAATWCVSTFALLLTVLCA